MSAALLFVVHPVHTEVVANIKGRDETMALMGSLAALFLLLKGIRNSDFKLEVLPGWHFFSPCFQKKIPSHFWQLFHLPCGFLRV
ncbi:MAG: hypothetical protein R2784_13620 [Saprospiraceae bacterium]